MRISCFVGVVSLIKVKSFYIVCTFLFFSAIIILSVPFGTHISRRLADCFTIN